MGFNLFQWNRWKTDFNKSRRDPGIAAPANGKIRGENVSCKLKKNFEEYLEVVCLHY